MALLAASRDQLRLDPSMRLILTGDLNALANSILVNYVFSGSADLQRMPEARFARGRFSQVVTLDQSQLDQAHAFKRQTRDLRGLVTPAAPASVGAEVRAMIKAYKDEADMVVSHPLRLQSAYSFNRQSTTVDFMFHGGAPVGPRLEIV
ncbi:hypothetical protein EC968_007445 [Mortierella alpina]|nr:hypothetical protein EC968_007445 [Mortierella alpina]